MPPAVVEQRGTQRAFAVESEAFHEPVGGRVLDVARSPDAFDRGRRVEVVDEQPYRLAAVPFPAGLAIAHDVPDVDVFQHWMCDIMTDEPDRARRLASFDDVPGGERGNVEWADSTELTKLSIASTEKRSNGATTSGSLYQSKIIG